MITPRGAKTLPHLHTVTRSVAISCAFVLGALASPLQSRAAAFVHIHANIFADDGFAPTSDHYDSGSLLQSTLQHTGSGTAGFGAFTDFAEAAPGDLRAHVTTAGGGVNNQGTGSIEADFRDFIHITSPTLPAGSPVQFQVTIDLHYSLFSNDVRNDPNKFISTTWDLRPAPAGGLSDSIGFSAYEQWTNPPAPNTYTHVYNTLVGNTLQLTGVLTAGSHDIGLFGGGFSHSDMDASNTATFRLVPITPDISYTSDLSASYVPEPASLALLTLAAPALLRRRKSPCH